MRKNFQARSTLLLLVSIVLNGCGGGSGSSAPVASDPDPVTSTPLDPALVLTPQLAGLATVTEDLWDETAVRNVLRTFAYGGHATDAQITAWADMPARAAVVEMLTFDQHNLKLSPVVSQGNDRLDTRDGTLRGLSEFWSSSDPDNPIIEQNRWLYAVEAVHVQEIWLKAATVRGLNPFRQKIGLWETNYHMAVNRANGVWNRQMVRYYDDIMNALEEDLPYQDVMAVAAKSAAVASQYGHRKNRYIAALSICRCNEDFAREYFQLFFGILGDYDPSYHETVTIKNMAAALTDMTVPPHPNGGLADQVVFGTEFHFPDPLEMLNVTIGGTVASERIDQLSQYAIEHPESLDNLPVMIVSGLADDKLDEAKILAIRTAWASMQQKSLIDFLRAYAVSTTFHSEDRLKLLTSIDRHLLMANQVILNNEESYLELYEPQSFEREDVLLFSPTHNVFGNQTSVEAAESSTVFRQNYNRVAAEQRRYAQIGGTRFGRAWEKDWASVVPKSPAGNYVVQEVAEWLWQRFIGDGLKNLGDLERAHIYALLATDRDLVYLIDPNDLERTITSSDIKTDPAVKAVVDGLAAQRIMLESADSLERQDMNKRVGQAINFILGTPYIFADGGGVEI